MLLKFFTNSASSAYLRGMAEEFGESTNAIRHELNNLSKAGYLVSSEEGRTILYRANTAHPLYKEIKNLIHKYLGIDEIVESIVSVGQPVELQLDAFPDLRLLGKLSRIVPTVDRSKATVLVKIEFIEKDKRVLPDMSAKVSFLQRELKAEERKPVTAVQQAAITKRDGRDVLFVIDDKNIVKQTEITVAGKVGDLVQVSATKPGDKVVLNPSEKLKDGGVVAITKK